MSSEARAVAGRERSSKFLYYCSSRYIHGKYQPQFWMDHFWIINLNLLHKFWPEFSVLIYLILSLFRPLALPLSNLPIEKCFTVINDITLSSRSLYWVYINQQIYIQFSNSLRFRLETQFNERIQLQIDSRFLEPMEPTRRQIKIIHLIQNKRINVNLAVFHFE